MEELRACFKSIRLKHLITNSATSVKTVQEGGHHISTVGNQYLANYEIFNFNKLHYFNISIT
jgi:hypothetical protein